MHGQSGSYRKCTATSDNLCTCKTTFICTRGCSFCRGFTVIFLSENILFENQIFHWKITKFNTNVPMLNKVAFLTFIIFFFQEKKFLLTCIALIFFSESFHQINFTSKFFKVGKFPRVSVHFCFFGLWKCVAPCTRSAWCPLSTGVQLCVHCS